MSHEATGWAFPIEGLKPFQKIVLLALANCHNPVYGCFPSQQYIAQICGMSERSVRDQLDALEALNLVRRVRINTGKGRDKNRYILGFEDDFIHPTANGSVGSPTANDDSPTANDDTAQRQELPPNKVKEPVIEPVNAQARISFDVFWGVWPNKVNKPAAEKAWKKLKDSDREEVVRLSKNWFDWWRKGNPTASPIQPASFLNGRRWEDEPFASTDSIPNLKLICGVNEMTIEGIRKGHSWMCRNISASTAHALIEGGYITKDQCKAAGISL